MNVNNLFYMKFTNYVVVVFNSLFLVKFYCYSKISLKTFCESDNRRNNTESERERDKSIMSCFCMCIKIEK